MIEFALERGWTINTPLEKHGRGGTVMIGVDDAKTTAENLAEKRVFVDWRPRAGLRVSPHFFNTDEEIEEALDTLATLIKR
jgi:kynureninase